MKRVILIISAFISIANIGYGQANLSFVDLDGFPSVIISGQAYNLTGYITNTGISSSSAVIDVNMLVNGTSTVQISNNFQVVGGIAPGDTIPWFENGFVFSSAYLVPNNNDILIWPTGPGTGGSSINDSLHKEVYFSEQAGFKTTNSMIDFGIELTEMEYNQSYPLSISSVNLGKTSNSENIKVYAAINENGRQVEIGRLEEQVLPGDTITYHCNAPFVAKVIAEQSLDGLPAQAISFVRFWMQESPSITPIERASIPVVDFTVSFNEPLEAEEFSLGNNPVQSELHLVAPSFISNSISKIEIINMQGQVVNTFHNFQEYIPVSRLSSGKYFIVATSESNIFRIPFMKL